MRLPSHPPAIHAITALKCYKCQGQHMVKDCTVVRCFNRDRTRQLSVKFHKTNSTAPNATSPTTLQTSTWSSPGRVHHRLRMETSLAFIPVSPLELHSLMEQYGGKDSFVNSKLLVNTGALLPSGIAISEKFFVHGMGGTSGR